MRRGRALPTVAGVARPLTPADFLIALVLVAAVVVLFAHVHGHSAHSILADPVRTPGVVNPNVTQANIRSTICRHGWTETIRPPVSYTNALKTKQMRQYGETGSLSDYQEDHLISLELGGDPTDPRNLWPEPHKVTIAGKSFGSFVKDGVESRLKHEVCDGTMTLARARAIIRTDWRKAIP